MPSIERYAAQGVKGILALRGDMPGIAGAYQPHPEGYEERGGTGRVACRSRRARHLCRRISRKCIRHPDLCHACLANLKTKLATGAKAAITQFFFDNRDYFHFLEQVRATGIHQPIIPGHSADPRLCQSGKLRPQVPGRALPDHLHAAFDGLAAHSSQHKARACQLAAQQIMQLAAQGMWTMCISTP